MAPVLVRHIMTDKVITLFEEESLPLAEDMMRFRKLRHLPVVDDQGRLVGLVTHRDILRAAMARRTPRPSVAERALEDAVQVKELLTRDVWTIDPDALASHAATLLRDHKLGCLPVVDHARKVVGIVTESDSALRRARAAAPRRRPRLAGRRGLAGTSSIDQWWCAPHQGRSAV